MQEIKILTNINTNAHYTSEGKSFESGNPIITAQSNFVLYWQLYETTPNADEIDVNVTEWKKAKAYTGCNAKLTCDDSWATKVAVTLSGENGISAGSEFPENINCIIAGNAAPEEISGNGEITLYNDEGSNETLYYDSFHADGSSVHFHVGTGIKAKYDHNNNEQCYVTQSVLFSAYSDTELSSPANGLFVFHVYADSNKLKMLKDRNDSGIISVVGLELLPYITNNGIIDIFPAFLFDRLQLKVTLGQVGISAEIGEEIKNSIYDEVNTLIAQGFSVQIYSKATASWGDYYEGFVYSSDNTKYRFKLNAAISDTWVEVPIITGDVNSYIDVTEIDSEGFVALEADQMPVAVTIDNITYDLGNCSIRHEEGKIKFLAAYFLAKANKESFSGSWRVWLTAKDGKPGDPGKTNYVFCLCQSEPPTLFDGLIWVKGGTNSPQYVSTSGGLNILTSDLGDYSNVSSGTIIIKQ